MNKSSSVSKLQQTHDLQKFSDITVPDELRISLDTGWAHINSLFTGEGIRPSTVGLITGLPGLGKTTLSLQLADSLVEQGHTVMYNSCEESAEQLLMTLERMKLENMIRGGYHASLCEVGEILDAASKLAASNKQAGKGFFLFVDSLQTIEKAHDGRGRPSSQQNQAVDAMWDIAAWCKDNMTVAMVIGMVTKDGTFAGKQEVKHAIDCHLTLDLDRDKKSETYGERVAEVTKNRFGVTGTYFPYEMTAQGISFKQ